MDKRTAQRRLAAINVKVDELQDRLHQLHEEDVTDAGHAIRTELDLLVQEAGNLEAAIEATEEGG